MPLLALLLRLPPPMPPPPELLPRVLLFVCREPLDWPLSNGMVQVVVEP